MTHSTAINVNGIRYVQTKEAETNFWVAFFGIAVGVLLGILLLRTVFTGTLTEQSLIKNSTQEQYMILESQSEFSVPSSADISV